MARMGKAASEVTERASERAWRTVKAIVGALSETRLASAGA